MSRSSCRPPTAVKSLDQPHLASIRKGQHWPHALVTTDRPQRTDDLRTLTCLSTFNCLWIRVLIISRFVLILTRGCGDFGPVCRCIFDCIAGQNQHRWANQPRIITLILMWTSPAELDVFTMHVLHRGLVENLIETTLLYEKRSLKDLENEARKLVWWATQRQES